MKDRITSGFIAGIVAALAMNIVDWLGYLVGLYDERLLNWASMMTLGRLPNNLFEVMFTQIEQIVFSGFLGIPFALILLKLTSGNYLFKGWLYGVIANEGIYAISILLKLDNFTTHTLNATISHFLSASVYGITLAYTLGVLDRRELGNI
ncbi:MAG: hypothetical protein ACOYVD_11680 [Bacillota bacterium]